MFFKESLRLYPISQVKKRFSSRLVAIETILQYTRDNIRNLHAQFV